MRLEEKFRRAGRNGKQYRGAPFWSWNDDLEPGELRRQIREMKERGLGGHFMHSRTGLITPYLSQRWMECIEAAVDESRKVGIDAWLYDEDKWPSGSVGRVIPNLGREWQQKSVELAELEPREYSPQPDPLVTFIGRRRGKEVTELRRLPDHTLPSDVGELTVFHFYTAAHGYADLLKPEVVEKFIELTHEAYKQRVGDEFGKTIPGIFTDEPNYRHVPWTEDLPRIFRERNGYDLLENLLAVFYEWGDFHRVRHDFWSTVTDLYVENFSRRIFDWCARNNLALTGHQLYEDTLLTQIKHIGSAMQHYEYMQVPGIDHLGRHVVDPLLCKQVSSVAHQFGGRRVLSETYGTAGWNLTFEDQKWIGDWQYAQGVDLLCQHLELYSMRGHRKRDYPPSLYYQQPWWPDNHVIADYFARLGAALTSGRHRGDLLLLHPMGSAWAIHDPYDDRPVAELSDQFSRLSTFLLHIHRDYDYGDEKIIERHGSMEGSQLRIGACRYQIVMVPPSVSIRTRVLDLLLRFAAAGGRIICVEPLPGLEQGAESNRPADELRRVATIIANDRDELRLTLDGVLEPEIIILEHDSAFERALHALGRHEEDAHSVWYQQRDAGDRQIFFLANTDNKREVNAEVRLRGRGLLEDWDLQTGKVTGMLSDYAAGYTSARITLAPAGSRLLALNRAQEPVEGPAHVLRQVRRIAFEDRWQVEPHDYNALTLDYCAFRLGDAALRSAYSADVASPTKAGSELPLRSTGGAWREEAPSIWLHQALQGLEEPTPLGLRFTFPVEVDPARLRSCFLVVEQPERYQITVNGRQAPEAHGWWTDISFRKIQILDLLRLGTNLVEMTTTAEPGLEVESIYVIGEFGVARSEPRWQGGPPSFALTEEVRQVTTGDLGPQGYRFFRGSIVYRQALRVPLEQGQRALLRLEGLAAVLARVTVNSREAGYIAWRPHELDVTELLNKRRINSFEIELFGSCRNLLGPHHNVNADPVGIGPRSFYGGARWREDPRSADGVWRDRYSFVPFGITRGAHIAILERVDSCFVAKELGYFAE